jgi:protein TilB
VLCLSYLTGNPCTDFEGYRKYVIVTLPQLKYLDGQEIERSERILAAQEYDAIKALIVSQEQQYKGLFLGLFNNAFPTELVK